MKPAAQDLEARRPVWSALADMFLDTDVSLSRDWRVRDLAESPYTLEELEAILIEEVYPVCWSNLMSVAGEWAGFDPQWLESRILARASSSPLRRMLNLGRLTVPASSEWRATKAALVVARRKDSESAV